MVMVRGIIMATPPPPPPLSIFVRGFKCDISTKIKDEATKGGFAVDQRGQSYLQWCARSTNLSEIFGVSWQYSFAELNIYKQQNQIVKFYLFHKSFAVEYTIYTVTTVTHICTQICYIYIYIYIYIRANIYAYSLVHTNTRIYSERLGRKSFHSHHKHPR